MVSSINVGKGRIKVDRDSVRIILSDDFCKYYRWFVLKQPWTPFGLSLPKHGSHITIINPKIHNVDVRSLKKYDGLVVDFLYDLHIRKGGQDFTNYWMLVECPFAQKIKKELNIKDCPNYKGLHITICNNKNYEKTYKRGV